MRVEDTELESKRELTYDTDERLAQRERESQQINSNLNKLKESKGHDMAALNPMVGGY